MERLTTNKDASEMNMFELARNSCFVKEGNATYRDFEGEVDARELTRKLLKQYAEGDDAFTCDDDFDEYMLDCLQYGTDTIKGLIALFYRNLWAQADLHNTLKAYEDTGLTPEQMLEIDKLYSEQCRELKNYKDLEEKGSR